MHVNKFYQKGFTLIELMVVMAIIAILAAVSYAGYSGFNKQQQINIAYDDLRSTLAEAKSYAASQVVRSCNGANDVFHGYFVEFNISEKRYYIKEACQNGANPIASVGNELSGKTLDSSLTISAAPVTTVRFLPLTGGVDSRTVISLSNGSITKTITITPEGNIQ